MTDTDRYAHLPNCIQCGDKVYRVDGVIVTAENHGECEADPQGEHRTEPLVTVTTDDQGAIVSGCCRARVHVSRIVRDCVRYDPEELDGDTLVVRYNGRTDALDSETGYEAECSGCGRELTIEIEEN